jgi:uncharacterized protein YkwD
MRRRFSFQLFLLVICLLVPTCTQAQDSAQPDVSKAVASVIDQTNALRKENGFDPVKPNDKLTATADYFAKFMADSGKYGHDADGHLPSERATKHGYEYALINENIAWQSNSEGFTTEKLADGFAQGWAHSPEHRKNMLDPDVVDIGVAIAKASDGKYYAVQMFGRPKSAATTFSIQNRSSITIHYKLEDQTYELKPNYTRKHTVGRPPEIAIELPGEKDATEVRVLNGAEYVIKPAKGGNLEVSGKQRPPTTQHATTQPTGRVS